ncbi:MAG: hypothetical protein JXR73_21735 [Candidatus Omnitrophica bacterium]|nr:hypothetical protein [Candidatus Omnitrophota bacterium]
MNKPENDSSKISRRSFGAMMGSSASGILLHSQTAFPDEEELKVKTFPKKPAFIRGAFTYPPTKQLDEEGYYSWPGSSFNAEGRQEQYMREIRAIEKERGMRIEMDAIPLDKAESVDRFIQDIKQSRPDGLFLIPFKKSHFENVVKIIDEVQIPTIVLASLGIILNAHIQRLHNKPGVYLINSLDNLEAASCGLNMIRTACWMRDSRIANITGTDSNEISVPALQTKVRNVPSQRFYDLYQQMTLTPRVKSLAQSYLKNSIRMEEPAENDVYDAAKTYFVLKQIIEETQADAMMMNCLPGLKRPHQHVPPCMGFMNLRDEGIPAGCESDLDATLSMMLIQQLFNKPAFQHNPSMDTEKNHYFAAHCTSASKMNGPGGRAEPYILRSHAEAGWGCVPRVLFPAGQDVTFIKYLSRENPPQILVYSGHIVGCPNNPPTGGCRTNVELELDDMDDVCNVKGHHLCLFYGQHKKDVESFCRLYNFQAVS